MSRTLGILIGPANNSSLARSLIHNALILYRKENEGEGGDSNLIFQLAPTFFSSLHNSQQVGIGSAVAVLRTYH